MISLVYLYHVYSLIISEKLLPRLLDCVEADGDNLKTVAASALWALVYNNQKVNNDNMYITALELMYTWTNGEQLSQLWNFLKLN